jgi:hypothetical protein
VFKYRSLTAQNLRVFITLFQGDATRQKKNFITLDEVIDDNRTFFIRFLLQAGLKVSQPLFHSQVWIQRRWGQTGTDFLRRKKAP